MIKKLLKGWLVFVGISWVANGISENYLAIARHDYNKKHGNPEENSSDLIWECVWKDTIDNFVEGTKLIEESE